MTSRRFATDRPTPRVERGDEPPRAACADNAVEIGILIDSPSNQYALRDIAALCQTPCPFAATCLYTTREQDEYWHPAAHNLRAYIKAKAKADAA